MNGDLLQPALNNGIIYSITWL